ncbi:MAG: hypothetical protein MR582_01095 [Campylobacter sp.]|nr:hypothetical protein [Campylobacter sp.]
MNKFLFSAVISAILTSGAFAVDLLASLTNGKISDNSPGVKVLSLEEAKQVKGGYLAYELQLSKNEWAVLISPSIYQELYPNIVAVESGQTSSLQISPFGQEYRKALASIANINNWQNDYIGTRDLPFNQLLGYTVTKHIESYRGQSYAYFTYKVITFDRNLKTFHNITSSALLSSNLIIKELSTNYKQRFEAKLGGYSVK